MELLCKDNAGHQWTVPETMAGLLITCPKCGAKARAPQAPGAARQKSVEAIDARLEKIEHGSRDIVNLLRAQRRNTWLLCGLILTLGLGIFAVVLAGRQGPGPPSPYQARIQTLTLDCGGGVKMELVFIPAGTFTMGSNKIDGEKPPHQVTISKPFYMGRYEVTQAQWQVVMGSNPSSVKGADLPVEQVSWNDCQEFCKKLSAMTNKAVRLPTEAEWEYACRAGTTTPYSFGDDETPPGSYAWYNKNSEGLAHPVGQKKANAWGLYDMHGNAYEWCNDWYSDTYYSSSPSSNPTGPASGTNRVLRGSNWLMPRFMLRSAFRFANWPDDRGRAGLIGLRVAVLTQGVE